jgi:hypothetical protein
VLGGGDDVGLRSVGDDDALARGRVDIDVVDSNTGPGDDLELLGLGQQSPIRSASSSSAQS